MKWIALVPVAVIVLIWIKAAIDDHKSGTGEKERRVMGTVLTSIEGLARPGIQAAIEYRKQVHDEEDAQGGKKPLIFTGVGDDLVEIRQVDADPAVPQEFDGVICLARVAGRPVAGLRFWREENEERTFGMSRSEGEGLAPDLARRIERLLLAYLFEMESAAAVLIDQERITPETVAPKEWPFHLLLPTH